MFYNWLVMVKISSWYKEQDQLASTKAKVDELT